MRRLSIRFNVAGLLFGALTIPVHGEIFSSEFFSDPVSEGWDLVVQFCGPETWNNGGWYHQRLDLEACPPGPGGGIDVYRQSLEFLNGVGQFFVEFRVQTDGDRSEIPGGAPVLVALANDNLGTLYHVTVSRDLIKFARDVSLPIWFIEVASGVPHTYRIEQYPEHFAFYIDGFLVLEGVPEGALLANSPRISWRGKSWFFSCHNAWDYIRYGVIPQDASGDYDSDGATTLDEFYFFYECLTNDRPGIKGGPGNDAGPGCRFTDFDFDADTDLLDFAEFQNVFSASHP